MITYEMHRGGYGQAVKENKYYCGRCFVYFTFELNYSCHFCKVIMCINCRINTLHTVRGFLHCKNENEL